MQHEGLQHGKLWCLVLFTNVFSYAQDITLGLGLELFCYALVQSDLHQILPLLAEEHQYLGHFLTCSCINSCDHLTMTKAWWELSQMAANSGLIFLLLVGLQGPHLNFTRAVPYLFLLTGFPVVASQSWQSPLQSDVLLPLLQTGGTDVDLAALMPEEGASAFQRHFHSQWSQGDFNVKVFFCKTCLICKPAGYRSIWHNGYFCNSWNCHLSTLHYCRSVSFKGFLKLGIWNHSQGTNENC